jgi:hypothetical protein
MVRVRNDTIVQLGVAMIFTMIFTLISSTASPYRRQENDYYAVACNFSLTAVFLFCAMLKVKSSLLTPLTQPLTPLTRPFSPTLCA